MFISLWGNENNFYLITQNKNCQQIRDQSDTALNLQAYALNNLITRCAVFHTFKKYFGQKMLYKECNGIATKESNSNKNKEASMCLFCKNSQYTHFQMIMVWDGNREIILKNEVTLWH